MGRTSSITMRSMVGIMAMSRAGCRRKSVMFFFVCLFLITLWNDEVCDNGNAMKQYKFQNNYGVIAWRKVCSCAPMFKFSYWPHEFFQRGKFFTKNYHFGNFWSRTATFLKLQRWNLACGCGLGASSPCKILLKNDLRGYTPLGKIYTKNYHFWWFFGP